MPGSVANRRLPATARLHPSSADRAHGPVGLLEPGLVDAMAKLFAADGLPDHGFDAGVIGAVAQWPEQICLVQGEETGAELPVGSQAQTVMTLDEALAALSDEALPPDLARRKAVKAA